VTTRPVSDVRSSTYGEDRQGDAPRYSLPYGDKGRCTDVLQPYMPHGPDVTKKTDAPMKVNGDMEGTLYVWILLILWLII
jgi:hypothetical protein